jgi:hypothetical protein
MLPEDMGSQPRGGSVRAEKLAIPPYFDSSATSLLVLPVLEAAGAAVGSSEEQAASMKAMTSKPALRIRTFSARVPLFTM